jgi:hypothetical protein
MRDRRAPSGGFDIATVPIAKAAKLVRGYAERGDAMALEIFRSLACCRRGCSPLPRG